MNLLYNIAILGLVAWLYNKEENEKNSGRKIEKKSEK